MQVGQVRLIGRLFMAGVLLMTVLAVVATRLMEPLSEPVFLWLIYVSAVALVVLAVAGGPLARRLASPQGPQGIVVPLALTEGMAMLGLVSSALSGQAAWAGGIGLLGLVIMGRLVGLAEEPGT
ncbi:MAG: hypothetical protein HKO53_11030 [Gemmatimonadetes bacterium]|nr:hypothetical protein [Gemmatimonadota bacterium]NNM33591.1 hypothetical protein [Gemmatimonadota bacterium]